MATLQPLLARNRYSGEEWRLANAGKCGWVVEHGARMGRVSHCGRPSDPASCYRYCASHDRDARDMANHGR